MSWVSSFAWLLFMCIVSAPITADAAGVDVTGFWTLTVVDPGDGCQWTGTMSLSQVGMNFTGSAVLDRVSGVTCPVTLTGTVSGIVSGPGSGFVISFGFASGELGNTTFDGTVSDDGRSGSGTWSEDHISGTWSAEKLRQAAPALSGIALATLFGLLMAGGVFSARRRAVNLDVTKEIHRCHR